MKASRILIAAAVLLVLICAPWAKGVALCTETPKREETQTQENNPGTGTITQEQEREREQEELQLQEKLQESKPQYSPKNEDAQKRVGSVGSALENLTRLANRVENAGVANQLYEIVQVQVSAEDRVNQAIDRAERRSAVVKFFLGPDYKSLKDVKGELEQNRLRIQEFNQIRAQISNQGDQTELANQIAVLEEQNTALQNQLNDLVSGFSLLGWLFRLIYRY